MPRVGDPCPQCGWPIRRKARTAGDWRSTCCSNPECEAGSTMPGVARRPTNHSHTATVRPVKTDWPTASETTDPTASEQTQTDLGEFTDHADGRAV